MQLFIFHLSSLISPDSSAPAALASLLFDPQEPQNIGKTQCFATFLPCAHLHLLSSDSFSSLIFFLRIFFLLLFSSLLRLFPPLLFHLSILSEIGLLSIYLSVCLSVCLSIYLSISVCVERERKIMYMCV